MGLKLITPPTVEPVTAAEAKAFLPALAGISDATVDLWIAAARETFDGWNGILGRALITQTWELQVDAFPLSIPWGVDQLLSSAATEIRIPLVPVQSVSQVAYDDVDGIQQIIDPADYYLDSTSEPGWLFPVADVPWPTAMTAANAVRVRFVAGYGDTGAAVPRPIRQAIILSVALSNSLMSKDLFVQSVTVDQVGSRNYSGGTQATATMTAEIERLVSPYRVSCGIS
jgi:uncharacterized phiE125 gp8 family phage protein